MKIALKCHRMASLSLINRLDPHYSIDKEGAKFQVTILFEISKLTNFIK